MTDPSGGFQGGITAPASALPGSHQVGATGESSGEVASAPYLVRTDWPQFHFTVDHRGLNPYEKVLSPATVPDLVLKWEAPAGGEIDSSTAVVGGVAYTAGEIDISQSFVEAFRAATGKLLWKT